jgi:hypothetical protein
MIFLSGLMTTSIRPQKYDIAEVMSATRQPGHNLECEAFPEMRRGRNMSCVCGSFPTRLPPHPTRARVNNRRRKKKVKWRISYHTDDTIG